MSKAIATDFTNEKNRKALAKSLMNNDETVLTCKFLEHQARLGRSLVIDLDSEPGRGFR